MVRMPILSVVCMLALAAAPEREWQGEGIVVNQQGQPVPDAVVGVLVHTASDNSHTVLSETVSDGSGHFAFAPTRLKSDQGVYLLTAFHSGYGLLVQELNPLRPSDVPRPYRLVLPAQTVLRGVVKDGAGKPVADAKVSAGLCGKSPAFAAAMDLVPPPQGGVACTGKDGAFSINGLPEDRKVFLLVEHPDYAPTFCGIVYKGGNNVFVISLNPGSLDTVVTLDSGAEIKGSVVQRKDGKAVGGVRVSAYWMDRLGTTFVPEFTVVSDADGRFRFRHLCPGHYKLAATAEDAEAFLRVMEELVSGESVEETLVLDPLRTLSGTVVNRVTGEPFAPGAVSVGVKTELEASRPCAPVAADGTFSLRTRPGLLTLSAFPVLGLPGRGVKCRVVLPSDADRTGIRLELLPFGSIEGRVLDEEGKGVAGAVVYKFSDETITAADGSYRIALSNSEEKGFVGPIRAAHPDCPDLLGMISVYNDGKTRFQADIVLKPTGSVRGRVVDQEGKPVARVKIQGLVRFHGSSFGNENWQAVTDEAGEYELSGLMSGRKCDVFVSSVPKDFDFDPFSHERGPAVVALAGETIRAEEIQINRLPPSSQEQEALSGSITQVSPASLPALESCADRTSDTAPVTKGSQNTETSRLAVEKNTSKPVPRIRPKRTSASVRDTTAPRDKQVHPPETVLSSPDALCGPVDSDDDPDNDGYSNGEEWRYVCLFSADPVEVNAAYAAAILDPDTPSRYLRVLPESVKNPGSDPSSVSSIPVRKIIVDVRGRGSIYSSVENTEFAQYVIHDDLTWDYTEIWLNANPAPGWGLFAGLDDCPVDEKGRIGVTVDEWNVVVQPHFVRMSTVADLDLSK